MTAVPMYRCGSDNSPVYLTSSVKLPTFASGTSPSACGFSQGNWTKTVATSNYVASCYVGSSEPGQTLVDPRSSLGAGVAEQQNDDDGKQTCITPCGETIHIHTSWR